MDDLLGEPTLEERAAALSAALRGQQQPSPMLGMGQAFMLHPLLAQAGQHMAAQALQQQAQDQGLAGRGLASALQERQNAREMEQLKNAERHQQVQEDIARQQLAQGRFAQGAQGVLNTRTGELVPYPTGGGKPMSASDIEKSFENFRKSLSTTEGRSHLAPQLQQAIQRANGLEALAMGPDGKPLDLNPQNVREAVTMFATLAQQGGQPAISQIEHFVPDTLASKFANWKQMLTNEPQSAEAQAFLRQMLESAAREKGVAQKSIREYQLQNLPAFADLRKLNRQKWDAMISAPGIGIDPTTIDDLGHLIQQASTAPAASAGPVKISTKEEFAALPSGTDFIDPKGVHRRKP